MAIRMGRAGVAGQVVALVPGLLEVGFVPAAAGQAEHRRAEHVLQLLGVAVGTHLRVRVRQLLQVVKTMAARATLEFIDGHAYSSYPVPGQANGPIMGAHIRISSGRGNMPDGPCRRPATSVWYRHGSRCDPRRSGRIDGWVHPLSTHGPGARRTCLSPC